MAIRYSETADAGLQDTQMLEWSDLTTLTLLTLRLAGEGEKGRKLSYFFNMKIQVLF